MYYARVINPTMLTEIGFIAAQQENPTEKTLQKVKQFLDYVANHTDAIHTYHTINIVLADHNDASYLSESKVRSRAGGHLFMSTNTEFPTNNGSMLTIVNIIEAVISS